MKERETTMIFYYNIIHDLGLFTIPAPPTLHMPKKRPVAARDLTPDAACQKMAVNLMVHF
jgi:hypothetical protein